MFHLFFRVFEASPSFVAVFQRLLDEPELNTFFVKLLATWIVAVHVGLLRTVVKHPPMFRN